MKDSLERAENDFLQLSNHRQKKVSFCNKTRIKRIPALCDYKKKNLTAMYHTTKEYKDIRRQLFEDVQVLDSDMLTDEEKAKVCVRGLESETKENRLKRNKRKKYSRSVVLKEQAFQQEIGEVDPSNLSVLYGLTTVDAVQVALERAAEDAVAAHEIYLEL